MDNLLGKLVGEKPNTFEPTSNAKKPLLSKTVSDPKKKTKKKKPKEKASSSKASISNFSISNSRNVDNETQVKTMRKRSNRRGAENLVKVSEKCDTKEMKKVLQRLRFDTEAGNQTTYIVKIGEPDSSARIQMILYLIEFAFSLAVVTVSDLAIMDYIDIVSPYFCLIGFIIAVAIFWVHVAVFMTYMFSNRDLSHFHITSILSPLIIFFFTVSGWVPLGLWNFDYGDFTLTDREVISIYPDAYAPYFFAFSSLSMIHVLLLSVQMRGFVHLMYPERVSKKDLYAHMRKASQKECREEMSSGGSTDEYITIVLRDSDSDSDLNN